ncbi:MAG: hypothetical protein ACR2JF_12345 [Iamia sp.]
MATAATHVGVGDFLQWGDDAGGGDEPVEDAAPAGTPPGHLGTEPHLRDDGERKHPDGPFQ